MQLYTRDIGGGTPLVLVHAFPLSSAMWLAQREGLAARFRVLTPDMRGFGGSPLGADEPSVDAMADDVAALLDTKGIDRAIIGGHSMGGYVALAFCRRHPDRALGAVLANTKATVDTAEAREGRLRTAERIDAEGNVGVLLEELLPKLVGPTTMRQRALVYGRVRGLVQSAPPAAAAWAQRAMAARPDSSGVLRNSDVPTLIVRGEQDSLIPPDEADALAALMPKSEVVVLAGAGHLPSLEVPEEFTGAVARWLE